MYPINTIMIPPPIMNTKGTDSETATFRALDDVIIATAAKAAGKNHTANKGCNRTTALSQKSVNDPTKIVRIRVNPRLMTMVCLAPSLSDAKPPRRPSIGPWARDKATTYSPKSD